MCFNVTSRTQPLIATEDIIVYKRCIKSRSKYAKSDSVAPLVFNKSYSFDDGRIPYRYTNRILIYEPNTVYNDKTPDVSFGDIFCIAIFHFLILYLKFHL